jgi:formamidopyrimidine-DNA glycosylase
MSGELTVAPPSYRPGKHDHLVIVMGIGGKLTYALIYNDPRMFGRVQFHFGKTPPGWWTRIAPPILSPQFTVGALASFLHRRGRAPVKAVLLMQERFPGVGNWMADEILWRAAIHPARPAGSLTADETRTLWRECRRVCRQALDAIAGRGKALPLDLNVNIPRTWLFKHRWRKGGKDPLTGTPLAHAKIGGRTTCWSPARQKLAIGGKR